MSRRLNYEHARAVRRYAQSEQQGSLERLAEAERQGLRRYGERSAEVPVSHRLYLNVPYSQRLEAKKLGCVWDKARKAWWTRGSPETLPANWLVVPRPVEQTAPEKLKVRLRKVRKHWRALDTANREIDLLDSEARDWN